MVRRYGYRSTRRTSYRPSNFSRFNQAFPRYLRAKFRLSHNNIQLTSTSGGLVGKDITINDLYSPDSSFTTLPTYLKSLVGSEADRKPYQRYCVYGAKIHMTFSTNGGTPGKVGYAFFDPDDFILDTFTIDDYDQHRNFSKVYDMPGNAQGTGKLSRSIYLPINKIFNISKQELLKPGDLNNPYAALYDSSPLTTAFFKFFVKVNTFSVTQTYFLDYDITFYTVLFDLNRFGVTLAAEGKQIEQNTEPVEIEPDDPDPEEVKQEVKEEIKPIPTYEELLKLLNLKSPN